MMLRTYTDSECEECGIPLAESPARFSGGGLLIVRCVGCGLDAELEELEEGGRTTMMTKALSRVEEEVAERHKRVMELYNQEPRLKLESIARAVGYKHHSSVLRHANGKCGCIAN